MGDALKKAVLSVVFRIYVNKHRQGLMMFFFRRKISIFVLLGAVLLFEGCMSRISTTHLLATGRDPQRAVTMFENDIGSYKNWLPEGKISESPANIWGLIDICNCYFSLGNMSKTKACAKAYAEFFLNRIPEEKDPRILYEHTYFELRYNRLLLALYLELGDYEKARHHAEKGIELSIKKFGSLGKTYKIKNHAAFMANAAIAFSQTGDKKRARELLAVIPSIKGGQGIEIAEFKKQKNVHQARGYIALGEYENAKKALERDLGMLSYVPRGILFLQSFGMSEIVGAGSQITDPLNLSELFLVSKIYLHTGEYDKARAGYDAMINNRHRTGVADIKNLGHIGTDLIRRPGLHYVVLHDRGKIALHDGDQKAAADYFRRAIRIIDAQRATIRTESSKIGFVGNKQAVYKDLTGLLIDMGEYEEAFAIAERSKARALVDMLAARSDLGRGRVSGMLKEFDELEKKAALNYTLGAVEKSLNLTRSAEVTLNKIREKDPEFTSLVTVTPPDLKKIQALLPKHETLIEYYGDDKELFIFLVTRGAVKAQRLKAGGISELVARFRNYIQIPPAKVRGLKKVSSAKSGGPEAGESLYNLLIKPVASEIRTQNLTIVPHGPLHYLPFNALSDGSKYMLENYRIRILPSAGVMEFLQKNASSHGRSLLAFGNPDLGDPSFSLPGAEKESRAITSSIKGASLFTGKEATETAVRTFGGQYRYIHFALHGTFDAANPLSSGLLMAEDEKNDGILTVGELYNLDISADMVTLSACETALGKVSNGDDVVGFTRGFLYAGARSIVSSLWKVDDRATSELMQQFYRELRQNDKREALRKAQINLKQNISKHPYYWAAFQLTGDI